MKGPFRPNPLSPQSLGFQVLERVSAPQADVAALVEARLPTETVDALKELGFTGTELADLVVPPRTLLHRRRRSEPLSVGESDRAVRLARNLVAAERAFGGRDKALAWLRRPLSTLDGRPPLELMRTEAGGRVVEDLIARIAWGAAA